jgi:hypothetical protein
MRKRVAPPPARDPFAALIDWSADTAHMERILAENPELCLSGFGPADEEFPARRAAMTSAHILAEFTSLRCYLRKFPKLKGVNHRAWVGNGPLLAAAMTENFTVERVGVGRRWAWVNLPKRAWKFTFPVLDLSSDKTIEEVMGLLTRSAESHHPRARPLAQRRVGRNHRSLAAPATMK